MIVVIKKSKLKKECKLIELEFKKENLVNGKDYSFSIMEAYGRITILDKYDTFIAKVWVIDKEIQIYDNVTSLPIRKVLSNYNKENKKRFLIY